MDIQVKSEGLWKQVRRMHFKSQGEWSPVSRTRAKAQGAWYTAFLPGISFSTIAAQASPSETTTLIGWDLAKTLGGQIFPDPPPLFDGRLLLNYFYYIEDQSFTVTFLGTDPVPNFGGIVIAAGDQSGPANIQGAVSDEYRYVWTGLPTSPVPTGSLFRLKLLEDV